MQAAPGAVVPDGQLSQRLDPQRAGRLAVRHARKAAEEDRGLAALLPRDPRARVPRPWRPRCARRREVLGRPAVHDQQFSARSRARGRRLPGPRRRGVTGGGDRPRRSLARLLEQPGWLLTMSTLVILVGADSTSVRMVRAVLRDWSAVGLLRPFLW